MKLLWNTQLIYLQYLFLIAQESKSYKYRGSLKGSGGNFLFL